MGIIITRWRTIVATISILAMFALVACGYEEAEAAANTPAIAAPTATQITIEVTAAPVPTETPVPAATAEPTAEPTVVLTDEISDDILAVTKAQPVIEFPASISKGAPELPIDEALAVWSDLLVGSRTVAVGETTIIEFCADGIGTWIWELGTPSQTGAPFDWELSGDPGGSWRSSIVTIRPHDQKLYEIFSYATGDGLRLGMAEPNQYKDWQIYEAITCS